MSDYTLEIVRNQDIDKLRKLIPFFRNKVFQQCAEWLKESKTNPSILEKYEFTRNDLKKILSEGSCTKRSATKLKDYQERAVKLLNENKKGVLLYFDTGTGKTLTALTISQCYLDKNPFFDVLVITPTKLKDNLRNEFLKYGGGAVLSDNYKFFTFSALHLGDKVGKIKPSDFNNPLLIVDEAHNLRNSKGKMFDTLMKYAAVSKRRVLLTATPVVNQPSDLVSIINILEGKYTVGIGRPPKRIDVDNGPEIYNHKVSVHMTSTKPKNLSYHDFCEKQFHRVMRFLQPMTLRVPKDVNDSDYPKYTIHQKTFEMPEEYLEKCRRFLETDDRDINLPFADLFRRDDIQLHSFYNGHRRLVNKIGKSYYSLKMDFIKQKIKEKKKTLIYTNWDDFGIQVLSDALTKIVSQSSFGIVSGQTNKADVKEAVEKYNSDKIKILMITKAGSEGLDLKGTRNVIIVDPVWNPSAMEQIIGRAVRYKSHEHLPASERQVDIYQLLMVEPGLDINDEDAETISGDVLLYKIIQRKEIMIKIFNEILVA